MLSGRGMEAVIGYGKDHDPNIGVCCRDDRMRARRNRDASDSRIDESFLAENADGFHPVTARRLGVQCAGGASEFEQVKVGFKS